MKTFAKTLPFVVLLAACGTMRETTQVRDDVYDIADRTAVASVSGSEQVEPAKQDDPYYDPQEAKNYSQRNYYDMTYNDPYYYNSGRFGFGSSYNMGYGGCGGGYGTMYDPYYTNSHISGYGAWNSYQYNSLGYNYGGCGCSTYYVPSYGSYVASPYQGSWGGCYSCYTPVNYGSSTVIVAHRPSMSGGGISGGSSGGSGSSGAGPRMMYRNPVSLVAPAMHGSSPSYFGTTNTARDVRPAYHGVQADPNSVIRTTGRTSPTHNVAGSGSRSGGSFGGNGSRDSGSSGGGGGSRSGGSSGGGGGSVGGHRR